MRVLWGGFGKVQMAFFSWDMGFLFSWNGWMGVGNTQLNDSSILYSLPFFTSIIHSAKRCIVDI